MHSIMNQIFKLDLIGPQIGLEHTNSTKFKSPIGAFISFISIVICTVIAFMFGKEIYLREAPKISITQELLENSSVKVEDLNLVFVVSNFNGVLLSNPLDYIDLSISTFTIFNNQTT